MSSMWWIAAVGYPACAALVLRRWFRPAPGGREPGPLEVAAITSHSRTVATAVTDLLLRKALTVEDGGLRRRGVFTEAELHPFTAGILHRVPRSSTISYERLERTAGREWRSLVGGLIDRGYLDRPAGWWRAAGLVAVGVVGVLLGPVGIALFGSAASPLLRWVFGLIAALLLVRAVVLIADIVRGRFGRGRMLRRTARAERMIDELTKRYRHLRPDLRPSSRLYGPRESLMGVALFGTATGESAEALASVLPSGLRETPKWRRAMAAYLAGPRVSGCGGSGCSGAYAAWSGGSSDGGSNGCGGGCGE